MGGSLGNLRIQVFSRVYTYVSLWLLLNLYFSNSISFSKTETRIKLARNWILFVVVHRSWVSIVKFVFVT